MFTEFSAVLVAGVLSLCAWQTSQQLILVAGSTPLVHDCDSLHYQGKGSNCRSGFTSMNTDKSPGKKAMGQKSEKHAKFPQTIEEFGYSFNSEGQLRHIKTGEPYKFEVKHGDRAYNQKHYEALGEVITEYVYELLETEGNLRKMDLREDASSDEPDNFIFLSENALDCDKLMVLIHGSGVVRAGQWTRKLIINDCLDSGTMLPYIRRAAKEGYGVLVTNGNRNYVTVNNKKTQIRGSENPEEHFLYVWDHIISKAKASTIVIVAHSYGGVVTVYGSKARQKDFIKRVKAVAFTDSVHSLAHQGVDKEIQSFFQKNARNWVSSDKPLDTPMPVLFNAADCGRVSAGTMKHEETSAAAFQSVFKYFTEKLGVPDEKIVPNEEKHNKQIGSNASNEQQQQPVAIEEKMITDSGSAAIGQDPEEPGTADDTATAGRKRKSEL